ncbi:hypothetical protein G7046_g3926 [Stylonectria norvegica]|nr:hypothetical protein G7046_g3926 [Stylonectria norvegica]
MAWVRNTPEGTTTQGPMVTGVTATFTGSALVILLLRLYVRGVLIKAFGYDDLLIVISWAGACVYTICTIIQTTWGLGLTSLDDMPDENVFNFGLVQYIGAPFYVVGIYAFKMSLLLSYLRFLLNGYRIATIIVAAIITMAHISFLCVFLFLCNPISKQWDPSIPLSVGHCAKALPFYLTFSSLTIIFDVTVLLLPFPALLKSQIQRRKKIVLLGLFALGIFVTIIQIIRIQTIKNLSNYLDSTKPILWSIIETDIGIIIASVPTLAPLVKYFAERSRNGTASGSHKMDSRYALQTWKSSKGGMHPLSSGIDRSTSISAAPKSDDSTENILRSNGITKQTEVYVTRQKAPSSNDSM